MAKSDKDDWLSKAGRSVAMWLELDLDAVENSLLHSIEDAADKTKLDWLDLMYRIKSPEGVFHVGEYAPAGDLECTSCGKQSHVYIAQKLRPCRHCDNSEFVFKDDVIH